MRASVGLSLVLVLGSAHAEPPPATPAATAATPDPVAEKVGALKEAGSLLEKANAARARGNKSFAEQLFSSAELIVGPDALAELAPLFREGAPPRITTPLKQLPKDTPPQPAVVGSSDEDQPDEKPKKGSLSGKLELEGKAPLEGLGVIMLEPASGKFKHRPAKQRVMEQRNRQFAPRLLAVPVGSTVSFPNFDAVFHNVFSRSEPKAFDLGIYKNGQAREMTFDKEGIVRLGCNLHANMAAYIVVVSAPHYAVTDAKGNFKFRSLEPGKYKLRAWSESSTQPATQDVVVKPEDNTITIKLAADAPSGPGTDKFGAPRGKNP
ncbi:MAG TPA: carboxypeptidase regulatory-like domain-containing protein [Polyangia bacterium]|nr:carboxypeptidase regulatory-like domain-containing protein [Polyangia bacterium]